MARRMLGQNRLPGVSEARTQLGPFQPLLDLSFKGVQEVIIDSESEDTDHTDHVKVLRAGLLLFKALTGDAKGKFVPSDHDDAPADNAVTDAVVLLETVDMRSEADPDVTEDVAANALYAGHVDEDKLFDTTGASYLAAFKAAAKLVKVSKHVS